MPDLVNFEALRRPARLTLAAAVAVALTGVLGGAGASSAPEAGPRSVVTRTEKFVDPSRPTGDPVRAPDRTLVTTIRFPESGGPYPLVVLAHGFNGHPRKFAQLLEAWARAGYVVAAPAFPSTNDRADGGVAFADYVEQPADVSLVIDEILRMSRVRGDGLRGRVDRGRIGVAGLSLGAVTTLGVTFNSCCRDDRIDAAIAMAGFPLPFDGAYDFGGVPLLLMHSNTDPIAPYSGSVEVLADAAPPKFLVTILGSGHSQPFEDAPDPASAMVRRATTDFWNAYLKDRPRALERLRADAVVDGLSTLEYDAG